MELRTKASRSDAVTDRERENLRVAYRAACEGIVLLKNDGALPFDRKHIALYGPGASMTIKGGTGSGEVNERHSVTILEGLRNRGFTIATEKWLTDFAAFYKEAEAAYKIEKRRRLNLFKLHDIMQMLFDNFRTPAGPAITGEYLTADTDSCVYVLSRQAGEGGDRKLEKGDYLLLCSDGLTNLLDDQELLFEVVHGGQPDDCCLRLLEIAKKRGAPDNVTCILVSV